MTMKFVSGMVLTASGFPGKVKVLGIYVKIIVRTLCSGQEFRCFIRRGSMKNKIHILGASGVGTSTLGVALSKHLPHTHLDTDDYYWTDKFTKKRNP